MVGSRKFGVRIALRVTVVIFQIKCYSNKQHASKLTHACRLSKMWIRRRQYISFVYSANRADVTRLNPQAILNIAKILIMRKLLRFEWGFRTSYSA